MFRSFGKITVAAAGTPARCTANEANPATVVKVQSVTVFALAGNTGTNIYLGSSTMNKSTLVGVYAIIPKGTFVSAILQQGNDPIAVDKLYLDADTSGDAALVSGLES
jgi:hypothetical protein